VGLIHGVEEMSEIIEQISCRHVPESVEGYLRLSTLVEYLLIFDNESITSNLTNFRKLDYLIRAHPSHGYSAQGDGLCNHSWHHQIRMGIPSGSSRGPNSCSMRESFMLRTQMTLTIKILECPRKTFWQHHWRQLWCSSSSSLLGFSQDIYCRTRPCVQLLPLHVLSTDAYVVKGTSIRSFVHVFPMKQDGISLAIHNFIRKSKLQLLKVHPSL